MSDAGSFPVVAIPPVSTAPGGFSCPTSGLTRHPAALYVGILDLLGDFLRGAACVGLDGREEDLAEPRAGRACCDRRAGLSRRAGAEADCHAGFEVAVRVGLRLRDELAVLQRLDARAQLRATQ